MKLKEYLSEVQQHGDISAFAYFFNGEGDSSADIEDFSIGSRNLRLEDLNFSLDTEGEVINDTFCFLSDGNTIGIQALL
jgi:hypothetical protein